MSFGVENWVAIIMGGSSDIVSETVKLLLKGDVKIAWCGCNQARLETSLAGVQLVFPEVLSSDMLIDVSGGFSREI